MTNCVLLSSEFILCHPVLRVGGSGFPPLSSRIYFITSEVGFRISKDPELSL